MCQEKNNKSKKFTRLSHVIFWPLSHMLHLYFAAYFPLFYFPHCELIFFISCFHSPFLYVYLLEQIAFIALMSKYRKRDYFNLQNNIWTTKTNIFRLYYWLLCVFLPEFKWIQLSFIEIIIFVCDLERLLSSVEKYLNSLINVTKVILHLVEVVWISSFTSS